jgi:hypothetical protein
VYIRLIRLIRSPIVSQPTSQHSEIRNPHSAIVIIHTFMKKRLLSCLTLCALFHSANAQLNEKQLKSHLKDVAKSKEKGSVVWSFDTIFNKGVPYCIMKKKNKNFFGSFEGDFYALNGKNVLYSKSMAEQGVLAYEILVLGTGQKAYIDDLEKGIVEAELFSGDSLNQTALNKFLMIHSEKPENKLSKAAGNISFGGKKKKEQVARDVDDDDDDETPAAAQPQRNRQASITMFGDEAHQDFKTIGTIKEVFGGRNMSTLYEIFDAGGRKIAEAEGKMHSTSWVVVTLKNNKAHTVTCASFKEKEAIMEYLTRLRYL